MSDVCIVGAGPAGSVLAARLAQLGHDVTLVERDRFPRSHVGECLSPGVLPLLESIGARAAVEAADVSHERRLAAAWGRVGERPGHDRSCLIVDRGNFDRRLLERAKAFGVRVHQPARVRAVRSCQSGWSLQVEADGRTVELPTTFLADASGRSAIRPGRKRAKGQRTLALYAYWDGVDADKEARIEAGQAEWYWGVPLPGGLYNALVFVDAHRLRAQRGHAIDDIYRGLLQRSGLLADCSRARIIGPVRAVDATPYLDEDMIGSSAIKVGDAALSLDPLSSTGVQKAIQVALAAAIVVNTILRQPARVDAARSFYRDNLRRASDRHRFWSASHYHQVAMASDERFWINRSVGVDADAAALVIDSPPPPTLDRVIELAGSVEFVETPCINGDFVTLKTAIRHPRLDGPVAYVAGWEVATLVQPIRSGMTLLQVVRSWRSQVPDNAAVAIAGWLFNRGILVPKVR